MEEPLSGGALAALAPLEKEFYQRATATVARNLLGKLLIRDLPEGRVAVRLTEVEAYLGIGDAAAHTFGGRRTPRNEVMWGDGGYLYVYFTYGIHFCCNVVTRKVGIPEAVLLRGAVPVHGEPLIAVRRGGRTGRQLLDGPAKLCQGLAIDRALNGADLTLAGGIWLASDGFGCRRGSVRRLPRVGVGYAGEAARWPLRFALDLDAQAARRRASRA
ncbi:MAG: DNA-3-methyladenine glycosylase [Thermoanaerobaculaceae bacterium]|jgi:DNA-3-methyladenine glycosylase